jgi:hypothetical protein
MNVAKHACWIKCGRKGAEPQDLVGSTQKRKGDILIDLLGLCLAGIQRQYYS